MKALQQDIEAAGKHAGCDDVSGPLAPLGSSTRNNVDSVLVTLAGLNDPTAVEQLGIAMGVLEVWIPPDSGDAVLIRSELAVVGRAEVVEVRFGRGHVKSEINSGDWLTLLVV